MFDLRTFFQLNRDDRKVIILLMLLVALFSAYVWAHNRKVEPNPHGDSPVIRTELHDDTIDHLQTKPDTLIKRDYYPGPLEKTKRRTFVPKLKPGATIDLNTADTLLLQRVPSIGASFARRIVKYREKLGGYYCIEQLQEVYGMDRNRYQIIAPFMRIKSAPYKLFLSPDSIPYHPYLSYRHRQVLSNILISDPPLTWAKIMSFADFRQDDSIRLAPYLNISPLE